MPYSRASSAVSRERFGSDPARFASPFPLILGVVSTLLSVALLATSIVNGVDSEVAKGVHLTLIPAGFWPISAAGYLLTPFLVILALGWDRVAQRHGFRDRRFVARLGYSTSLRCLVGLSVVIGLWHVINLASVIGGQLSETLDMS